MIKLNEAIDHTLLKPTATTKNIEKLCEEAIEHEFKAVCVAPFYVDLVSKILKNSEVQVCTVVGFPFGYNHIGTKLDEINRVIEAGADEIDVVVNIAAVKNGNWAKVEDELESITIATKLKRGKILKLILETAYLTSKEIKLLCDLCVKHQVDFAKTSTGYAPTGTKIEDVILMKEHLQGKVKIKASGGIKTKKQALNFIEAGADRLGTSSGIKLIK